MKGTYKIRPYFDTYVVYGTGDSSWNPNAMLVLNEVGYTIFTLLEKDASVEEIVSTLTEEYEVSSDTALKDTQGFIEILKKKNMY
jgi:hypothetical protein